jgi:hypothetical protein
MTSAAKPRLLQPPSILAPGSVVKSNSFTDKCCPAVPVRCNRWKQAVLATFRARDVAVGAPTAFIWLTMEDFSRG